MTWNNLTDKEKETLAGQYSLTFSSSLEFNNEIIRMAMTGETAYEGMQLKVVEREPGVYDYTLAFPDNSQISSYIQVSIGPARKRRS